MIRRTGVAVYIASTRLAFGASPARLSVITEEGKTPARNSSAAAEGTVLTSVIGFVPPYSARSRTVETRIAAPPTLRGANNSKTERSKQIDVDARTPASSCVENRAAAQSSNTATLECRIATPFGGPVEPDV